MKKLTLKYYWHIHLILGIIGLWIKRNALNAMRLNRYLNFINILIPLPTMDIDIHVRNVGEKPTLSTWY